VFRQPGEDDRPSGPGARIAVGQTEAGRYLRVVYVPDPIPQGVFVITAYDLVGKPLATYRRRRRRSEAEQIPNEEQTEAEAVAEDEAALEDQTQTVMKIPTELGRLSGSSLPVTTCHGR